MAVRRSPRLSGVRLRLQRSLREYRAIRVLANQLSLEDRGRLDATIQSVSRMSVRAARERLQVVAEELREVRSKIGVKVPLAVLESFSLPERLARAGKLRDWSGATPIDPALVWFPKYVLARLFSRYEATFPDFEKLPPHAQIGINVHGIETQGSVEVYLLEASLFEDMAMLFNISREPFEEANPIDKLKWKRRASLRRSAVKAIFNLLEGYINGIAWDVLLTRSVSAKEETLLQEWDSSIDRYKPLSLRDKLLKYPRLAIQAEVPPIDEGRCPAMGEVLNAETALRHSLIHPTPRVERWEGDTDREFAFRAIGESDRAAAQLDALCDSAIETIDAIDAVLGGVFGTTESWLARRNEDGLFSVTTFD